MSNYSYVVSRANVSILLTTLSNRTNPLFVANTKDENSTRHTSAITIVNNWHTSIAHSYGRVRHNAAPAASFLKPPSRRRGEDCIVRSMTYEQSFIRSHATCQTEQIRHSSQTLKIATCLPSNAPRYKLLIINITASRQLAHSSPERVNLLTPQNVLSPQLAHP